MMMTMMMRDHLEDTGVDGRMVLAGSVRKWGEGGGVSDWFDLVQDRNRWWALVNAVMNVGFP
jgi:hypothetical protein